MSSRESEATARAVKMVQRGATKYAAAKKHGVHISTITRAIERREKARQAH